MADYTVTDDGINLPSRTSDPDTLIEGLIWHRSDLNEIHGFVGGKIEVILPKKKSELDDTDFAEDVADIKEILELMRRSVSDSSKRILEQLKIMNVHLSVGSDENIKGDDVK